MGSPSKEKEMEHMRQQLHDLGEQMDRERQTAAADVERVKLEKENKKLRAQMKQKEKEKQVALADKDKLEKENKKLKPQLEVYIIYINIITNSMSICFL
jgi:metal-dependent amidase/aminoacylase/carboxypeptidase family protein